MKRIVSAAAALSLLLVAPSCATGAMARVMATPRAESGITADNTADDGWSASASRTPAKGRVAGLDDVTNGDSTNGDGTNGDGKDRRSRVAFFADGENTAIRTRKRDFSGEPRRAAPEPDAPKDGLNRKMIYTAQYSVMVTTVDEAITQLLAKTTELGGYLARRDNTSLTVRVPAAKFRTLLSAIPELGRVLSESMSASDVTNQHTDLTIRLENAEKSRQRLLALLEKATKVEDMIKIEDSLRRVTGEIERMKGQLKLMNDQIAFSTITVGFQANAPKAKAKRRRRRSRFYWINRIGIEQDLRRY